MFRDLQLRVHFRFANIAHHLFVGSEYRKGKCVDLYCLICSWYSDKRLNTVFLVVDVLFYQQIGLKFEEETNKMLYLEHGFVRC